MILCTVNIHKFLEVEKEEEQRKRCHRSDFEKGSVDLKRNPAESELVLLQNLLPVRSTLASFSKYLFHLGM